MDAVGVHLWAFVPIAALVIVAPGPDNVLVTKNAVMHGRAAALATALGVNTGLLVWTVAAAFGLAAVVRESAVAFTVLKVVGAAYLVWLGLAALRSVRSGSPHAPAAARAARSSFATASGFRQGLFSNLGNPKIAVFFTGLLPQFVTPGVPVLEPFLLLGGLFVLMAVVWLVGYALLAARAASVFDRPRVKAAIDAVTGVVLVALGVRLALERR
jgi:RhtB (resistance to homoserine/threonine) family protein